MDQIVLRIPAKPEYVMVVRLTASSIACRVDFCMDDIEDLKVAAAEACIMLMHQKYKAENLEICFSLQPRESLKIDIEVDQFDTCKEISITEKKNELGYFIVKALMDEVDIKSDEDVIKRISMYKKCGG